MCWDQMGSGRCTKFSALEHFMSFCVSPRSEFREIICLEVLLLRQERGLVRLPHFQASWGSLQWIYSKIPSQGPACNQTHLATPSGSLTSFVMKHLKKKQWSMIPEKEILQRRKGFNSNVNCWSELWRWWGTQTQSQALGEDFSYFLCT